MSKRSLISITILRLIILATFLQADLTSQSSSTLTGKTSAIDGDTIRINGQVKVRLSGVAAPERTEDKGESARGFMQKLVDSKWTL
jgi:endonuclease YncB( thermonuclease family)